jgi:cysteinyl-tRNA synthetase
VEGKRRASDFAVWRTSEPGEHRQMEWDSPWGRGRRAGTWSARSCRWSTWGSISTFTPAASIYRYLLLQAHYRSQAEFTFPAMDGPGLGRAGCLTGFRPPRPGPLAARWSSARRRWPTSTRLNRRDDLGTPLRDQLTELGVTIEDQPGGPSTWRWS